MKGVRRFVRYHKGTCHTSEVCSPLDYSSHLRQETMYVDNSGSERLSIKAMHVLGKTRLVAELLYPK